MIYGGMKGPSLNHTYWKNRSVSTHLRSGSSELFFWFSNQNNQQVTAKAAGVHVLYTGKDMPAVRTECKGVRRHGSI